MKILKNFELKDNTKKINKTDWIIIGIIVLLYGVLSFYRLGDTKVPLTYKTFESDEDSVIVELTDSTHVSKIRYYTGNGLGDITIYSSTNGEDYNEVTTLNIGSVFTWQDIDVHVDASYLKFNGSYNSTIGDIAVYSGNYRVPFINKSENPLTDEIDLVPEEISYMNSTYFDEIYYARSAYEYANGMDAYEWSHPPLGKIIMTIPVALFGFSPFTYRLMGNIFGILFIPAMYILAKKIFKNRKWAILAALLIMLDNFHFAHTRIALVDGFQVLFIILSVLFLKNYLDLEKDAPFKKKVINMALSGVFIGCAIATKWNAFYPAMGIAITFFVHLFRQYNFNLIKYCKKVFTIDKIIRWLAILILLPLSLYYLVFLFFNKNVASVTLIAYFVIIGLWLLVSLIVFISKDKYLLKLLIACIISYVFMPLLIYVLSYILFPTLSYYDGTVKGIIEINKMMYNYHSTLDATHPFSSVWYEWPIMVKPVWLYSGSTLNGLRMTITDIGNPAIWWFGVISFGYLVISSIIKKDKTNIFILIFILCSFVPYVFIGRLMFMYHYFITLPFIMLGITAFIKWITEKTKNDKIYYGYIILILITFIIFYPIVSGLPVSDDYINSLKWLSGWFF